MPARAQTSCRDCFKTFVPAYTSTAYHPFDDAESCCRAHDFRRALMQSSSSRRPEGYSHTWRLPCCGVTYAGDSAGRPAEEDAESLQPCAQSRPSFHTAFLQRPPLATAASPYHAPSMGSWHKRNSTIRAPDESHLSSLDYYDRDAHDTYYWPRVDDLGEEINDMRNSNSPYGARPSMRLAPPSSRSHGALRTGSFADLDEAANDGNYNSHRW
jgi:hypothetical protein